jgi:hypothetical protein
MTKLSDHMTVANPDFQAKLAATPTGMFNWVGSGPAGCTCFGCVHFDRVDRPRKPELWRRCARWCAWYRAAYGTRSAPRLRIPPQTAACSGYPARQEEGDGHHH